MLSHYFKFIIQLLLITSALAAQAAPVNYIIDTDIGGDIDDVLTLLIAMQEEVKPLAVTTVHIEPVEKARIAKLIMTLLGHPEIPVYAGIGATRKDTRAVFLELNPLWPPQFGFPNHLQGEREWFPQQSEPYRSMSLALFDNMQVEAEPAPQFIARIARKYSPQNKLLIIALGPLNNIARALVLDPGIRDNIRIYAMGGVYPKGYNWLISPETTAPVLAQVETVTVVSGLLEANQLYFSPQEFAELEKTAASPFERAVIKDWKNWYKVENTMTQKTNLADPVTLYVALHPEDIAELNAKSITFPCLDEDGKLKDEFIGLWYNKPGLKNKIITATETTESRAQFVTRLREPEEIRLKLLSAVAKSLRPQALSRGKFQEIEG